MSRIDEIKERMKSVKEDWVENCGFLEDMDLLLSKLEIAETELRKIIYSKLANHNVTPEEIILMADEALHQLRS